MPSLIGVRRALLTPKAIVATGGGGADPVWVQSAHGGNSNVMTPLAIAMTTAPTVGHLIYASVVWQSGDATASASDTHGNTYTALGAVATGVDGTKRQAFWAISSGSGANTVSIVANASANGTMQGFVEEYANVVAASPVDASAIQSTSATSVSSGSLTTTSGKDLLIAHVYNESGGQLPAGSGFTQEDVYTHDWFGASEWMVAGAAGSYSATFTYSGGAINYTCILVAFKKA